MPMMKVVLKLMQMSVYFTEICTDYEEDEEYDNSYGDEPVYGDEEGEMYRRSPPENYYDTEEGKPFLILSALTGQKYPICR